MVTFLFSVHTITEENNRQGGARTVDLLAMSYDLVRPGVAPPLAMHSRVIDYSVRLLSQREVDRTVTKLDENISQLSALHTFSF